MMTKLDIFLKVAQQVGVDQLVAVRIVQATLDSIIAALATEGRLELRDFGVFEVRVRKAKKARNPRTGQEVMAPERWWVKFKAGKLLEERGADGAAPAPGVTGAPPAVK